MNNPRFYLTGVVGLLLLASVAMNVFQYAFEHRLGYISHITVHTTPAPDSIDWDGNTYWTDGSNNPAFTELKWLGVGKAGSKEINVFEVVGVSSRKEIAYIMGGLVNVANVRT